MSRPRRFDKRPVFAQVFRGYNETNNGQHPALVERGPAAMLDLLFKPVRDLGYERFIFWLPAGKIPSADHVMPSANWEPLSKRDKIQWEKVFDWARKTRTSIEIYGGYNPFNPHTIEMPRGMLTPPDYLTNESDQEFADLNIKPWVDMGCKKIWLDWAMLKSNPANRASFLQNAQWLEKKYGIVVGGEAIPENAKVPDMKFISRHPFLAMHKFLMDPKVGRDLGHWKFPRRSEVVAVLNWKSNREYFMPKDYEDLDRRGYVLAATTIDQAIAIRKVLG
tara:strand:- start:713 stop:1546 length:834 start_codon:yes stop_codon:yes gene_type:complete